MTFSLPEYFEVIILILIQLLLAIAFFRESSLKLKDLKGFAKTDGVPLPAATVVAVAELCAAISMLTGILAQWAGLGIMVLMIITMGLHIFKWHSSYWASKRGWEYDLLLFALAGVIVVFGAGTTALFV